MHEDGTVRFVDAAGNETAGIATPWALDAHGVAIPTSYTLDGTTLVQTIEHAGAAYPVVADPLWIPVVIIVVNIALRASVYAPAVYTAYTTCRRAGCGPAIAVVARNLRVGDSSPTQRPNRFCRIPSQC